MFKNKKEGFTLAEVLIALVIIGVVAAITVPTIVANSNEKAIKAALKKNHSVLQQAMKRYYIDNGIHMDYETLFESGLEREFFNKYFNIACSDTDCELDIGEKIKYKLYEGKREASLFTKKLILVDGTLISYGYILIDSNNNISHLLLIDVNGPYKKPNKIGMDTFAFEIKENTDEIILGGSNNSFFLEKDSCNPNYAVDYNGYGCTAKMLKD